jgi:hypothetical protein
MSCGRFRVVQILKGPGGPHSQPVSPWYASFQRAVQELQTLRVNPTLAGAQLTITSLDDVRSAKERQPSSKDPK